jgi:hypothetical protein
MWFDVPIEQQIFNVQCPNGILSKFVQNHQQKTFIYFLIFQFDSSDIIFSTKMVPERKPEKL